MYITVPMPPRYPQMPIEALFDFDGKFNTFNSDVINDPSATVTTIRRDIPPTVYARWRPEYMLFDLQRFVETHAAVINRGSYRQLYRHFEIPKKNGKMRPIDEPMPQLRAAQDALVDIFKNRLPANHHASAYAYISKRETVDAAKKHQKNESHWYAKYDFHNFFGNTTVEFVHRMLKQIYPFSWIDSVGEWGVVESALSVCFLNGGLPQGSPISPMLTNIMMIPIDFELTKTLRNYQRNSYVYTRYADDMCVSSKYDFDVKKIEQLIIEVLKRHGAPFTLNEEKTHYGSRSGHNCLLGVHINADNKITVGHDNKRYMKAALTNYVMDRKSKRRTWGLDEVQTLSGNLSYYRHIEKDYFDAIVQRLSAKFGVDIDAALKADIKTMGV